MSDIAITLSVDLWQKICSGEIADQWGNYILDHPP